MENKETKIIQNDELDLIALWRIIWGYKIIIIFIMALFSIVSIVYAFYLPNIYRADAVLYPSSLKAEPSAGNNMNSLNGIASLAGINLGSAEASKTDFALAVLESREFTTKFIKKHNIKVPLFAITKWNEETGNETLNSELYDVEQEKWVIDPETGKSKEPTELEAYDTFKSNLLILIDPETGVVTVSYDSISPVRAKQWIDFIVEDLNVEIRNKDVVLADKGIQYLESQLEKTKIADIQNIFFKLIEDQISKKLLAETKEEYVFEVIDPAVVAEKKVKPSRVLICLLGAFIGSLLSMIVIFVLHLHKTNKKIS